MSTRYCLLALTLSAISLITGCSGNKSVVSKPVGSAGNATSLSDTEANPHQFSEVSLELPEPSAQERYQYALLQSLSLNAERKYQESLASLKAAQSAADTEEVQFQIARVQALIHNQRFFEKTVADIQSVIDSGQNQVAVTLIVQAMAQYEDAEQISVLIGLKRQADSFAVTQQNDTSPLVKRLHEQAEQALKDNNLRAALLSYDQALELKADIALQGQRDVVRSRLEKYDAAMLRGEQLRRETTTLDAAITAYQEAIQTWDTIQARQELADVQLALRSRRDRLGIIPFESDNFSELAVYGIAIADELLPCFKHRYDLVDRNFLYRVSKGLNITVDEIIQSEQGRSELEKLVQARYLVVGSLSPLSGVTIHARLIDLRSGLIVQTGKLVAPTPEAAVKQLSRLAAQLLMSDEDKLNYERQLAQVAAPALVNTSASLPPLPVYSSLNLPVPFEYATSRPPAIGALQTEDFDRFPLMDSGSAFSASLMPAEQDRPLRQRLLAVQVELGDSHYRFGRHRQALWHYQLARELDPASMEVLARINLCYQYLPPVALLPAQLRREKIAVLNFYVKGEAQRVPQALSTWVPDQLATYFAARYDVMDRSEVYWMMGRLGLTLSDVIKDVNVRRWLGRALGVRYLIAGRVEFAGNYTVTLSMLDAENGWESSRSQVVVRGFRELKQCLPELARLSMVNAAERSRMEKEAAQLEAEYLRAQEAFQRGQFILAVDIGKLLRKKQPMNVRFSVFLNDAENRARKHSWEDVRLTELDRQRQLAERAARQQAELAMAIDQATLAATHRASQLSEADRRRQKEQACGHLLSHARLAVQNNRWELALQWYDGALSLKVGDDSLIHEAAQVRARFAETKRHAASAEVLRREETVRRQHDLDLAASRQVWIKDRLHWKNADNEQRQKDIEEYGRLLDQAQKAKAQNRFDQAVVLLQAASRIHRTEEGERLLAVALTDLARARVKAEDASKFAELERKLVHESTRRKQVEQEAQRNWTRYQTALQLAKDAQRNRDFVLAKTKCQEAMQLFRTEEVFSLWKTIMAEENEIRDRNAAEQRKVAEQKKQVEEVTRLVKESLAAEKAQRFDDAIAYLLSAQRVDVANLDVLASLNRVKSLRKRELEKKQLVLDHEARVKEYLVQAKNRKQLKQFTATLYILEAARKLAPSDAEVNAQLAEVKKLQELETNTLAAARRKQEELRQLTAQRLLQEEKTKQLARQSLAQAETALRAGDLRAAEIALGNAARNSPNDPALIKLQLELTKAKNLAAREKSQADARARLEAQVQTKLSAAAKEHQGRINLLLNQAQAAIIKKDYPAAEKLIGDALALDSTNLAAGRVQRELHAARQADAKAKSAMNAVDRKKQEEEQTRKKALFAQHMKEGKEALASEDYEQAAKSFTAAKALNPEDPDAALFLGMANRNTERKKAEEEVARKEAEEMKKKEMEAAKSEADLKKKAEEELRRKLAMDADAKKRAEALKSVNRQQFDNAMKQGNQALSSKKYDEAIKAFERALQLIPDEKNAMNLLVQARQQKNESTNPEKKSAAKTAAPAKTPLATLLSRAAALRKEEKWNDALTMYRHALEIAPDDATAKAGAVQAEFQLHLETGNAALKNGNKQAAIKSFELALKVLPGNTDAQRLLRKAKELK